MEAVSCHSGGSRRGSTRRSRRLDSTSRTLRVVGRPQSGFCSGSRKGLDGSTRRRVARRLDVLDVEWLDGSTRRARLDVLDVEWLDVLDVLDVEWLDVEWLDGSTRLDVLDVEWLDCQCSTRLDSTCSTSSGSRRALSTCSLDVERATRRLDVLDVLDSTSREPLDGSTCSTARLDVLRRARRLDGSTRRRVALSTSSRVEHAQRSGATRRRVAPDLRHK